VLPSLLFAGIILEGGIIGFDSNTQTGGLGAAFLGIGGSTQYRQNSVTVFLRAVSVRTGEVLENVVTHQTVVSIAVNVNVFRFVRFDELLEAEAGTSTNEPMMIAVQSAIEKAVYALIMEGAQPGPRRLWTFADANAGNAWLARYAGERARAMSAASRRGRSNSLPRVQAPSSAPLPPQGAAAPAPSPQGAATPR
jgi:curli production assembly/transport component CsgG